MDLAIKAGNIDTSTDIIDEYLTGKYRYLVFLDAASIFTDVYQGKICYVLRVRRKDDFCVPRYITVTDIRKNISRRYGPKPPQRIFEDLITNAVHNYIDDFKRGCIVPLTKYICVHAQSSQDRSDFGWYPYTAFSIIGIHIS